VSEETPDFGIEHADQLTTARHFDAEHALDRQGKGMLLVHRGHVVEAVEIGNRLQVGLVFDQLFGAAVKQADVRIDTFNKLAIELENHAQHAVGRGVNRAEVDREIADVDF